MCYYALESESFLMPQIHSVEKGQGLFLKVSLSAAVFLWSGSAYAQGSAQNVGDMITRVGDEFGRILPDLIWTGCLLVAVFLVATGLGRLIEMSNSGRDGMGKDVLLRLFGGGFLAGLPFMVGNVASTFYDRRLDGWGSAGINAENPNACMTPAGGSIPFSCVAENIALNVAKPGTLVLFGLAFVAGTYLVGSGFYKLAVSQAQGNNAEAKAWMPRVVFGAVLSQLPPLIAAVAITLGYGNSVITSNGLQQVAGPSLSISGPGGMSPMEMNSLLGNIFLICVFFGVLSVWRGLSKLRSYAEGAEREGVGMAMTHILGGVMLVNIKTTICFVVMTFMGNGMGFC